MKKFLLAFALIFALTVVTAPKAHAFVPPGCIAAPIDVTPISAPYNCSVTSLVTTCQNFSGLCLTGDSIWYQEVEWTTTWYCDSNAGTCGQKGDDGD